MYDIIQWSSFIQSIHRTYSSTVFIMSAVRGLASGWAGAEPTAYFVSYNHFQNKPDCQCRSDRIWRLNVPELLFAFSPPLTHFHPKDFTLATRQTKFTYEELLKSSISRGNSVGGSLPSILALILYRLYPQQDPTFRDRVRQQLYCTSAWFAWSWEHCISRKSHSMPGFHPRALPWFRSLSKRPSEQSERS